MKSRKKTRPSFKTVFTRYQDLLDALATLGKPARGHVRVFRGQTQDFGVMVPSGLRGTGRSPHILLSMYSEMVAGDIAEKSGVLELEMSQEMLRFGMQTIAQHYGPWSQFMDVSHSIDIALWFAFHAAREISGAELKQELDITGGWSEFEQATWVKYSQWKESHGFLYIFDVPEWISAAAVYSIPQHGQVVDLLRATSIKVLQLSKRIQVQRGCLLKGDPDVNGGDLSSYYACDPVRVKWPMEGAPAEINRRTEEMFPLPGEDPWYGYFLSAPLFDQIEPSTKRISSRRPLPVVVYWPEDVWKLGEITLCFRKVSPTLSVYPGLEKALPQAYEEGLNWVLAPNRGEVTLPSLSDATKILMEGPVLTTILPVASGFWNHETLMSEIADEAFTVDLQSGEQLSTVSLQNVFIEFSPMEHVDWHNLPRWWGKRQETPTSLWMVRRNMRFFVLFLYQAWPKTNLQVGPQFFYEFDVTSRRFYLCFPAEGKKGEASGIAWSDSAFFAALNILRKLSRTRKVNLAGIVPREDGRWNIGIKIRDGELVRPMRAANDAGSFWYVLRDVETNEPYREFVALAPLSGKTGRRVPKNRKQTDQQGAEKLMDVIFQSSVPWDKIGLDTIRAVIESRGIGRGAQ